MIRAHRIALDPTFEQKAAFSRACGCARFAWNWALAEWERQLAAGGRPKATELRRQFNAIKRQEFPWLMESPKDSNQEPFRNLHKAFVSWWKSLKSGGKVGRPQFKRKGRADSYYISNDLITLDTFRVRIPVIGWVRTTESVRLTGRLLAATISREADRWFISMQVEVDNVQRSRTADSRIGVDLGIIATLACSDGQVFNAPKPLKANLKRLRRLSQAHSRKKCGSKNKNKSRLRLARLHARIKNIRLDWIHKITTKLVRENQTICLENLGVSGMRCNRTLARAVDDVGFYEIRRQLEYKAPMYGGQVVVINRWLPTSKTCSRCGCKTDVLALSERVFKCNQCGFEIDRDLNAARNILAAGLAVSACGPEYVGVDVSRREVFREEAGTRPGGQLHAFPN